MLKAHRKHAFSLIELSIVILIIGILVAGVTQSSRLINQMRLASARNTTVNSPLSSINNLIAWFEPTLEASFLEDEAVDNAQISLWKEARLFSTDKVNLVRNKSAGVVYKKNGINNLPSIYFNGTTGGLFLSPTTSIAQATYLDTPNQRISVFMVYNINSPTGSIFINGHGANAGFGYYTSTGAPQKRLILFGGINVYTSNNNYVNNVPEIASIIYNGRGLQFDNYINGELMSISVGTPNLHNINSRFIVGASNSEAEQITGLISEVIIFDRALKKDERQDIEKYLAKKYAIKINQS
jgi:prepilin-type N-terminal cleavage/methylation domain-containing protein